MGLHPMDTIWPSDPLAYLSTWKGLHLISSLSYYRRVSGERNGLEFVYFPRELEIFWCSFIKVFFLFCLSTWHVTIYISCQIGYFYRRKECTKGNKRWTEVNNCTSVFCYTDYFHSLVESKDKSSNLNSVWISFFCRRNTEKEKQASIHQQREILGSF